MTEFLLIWGTVFVVITIPYIIGAMWGKYQANKNFKEE